MPGNVGIILSVPHGGCIDNPEIPDRTDTALTNLLNNNNDPLSQQATLPPIAKKVRTTGDGWTIDLGAEIYRTVSEGLENGHPHLVVCNLKRSKVDVNRDVIEGALGNETAWLTHNTYHAFIRKAKSDSKRGVLFDIHGQSHGQNKTEIGYLLTTDELNEGQGDALKSSIRRLHQDTAGREDLIAGPQSFGAMLEAEGYAAFPSPRQPCPGPDKYFFGGFITRCHGSAHSAHGGGASSETPSAADLYPVFDAIQLETPRESRMEAGEEEMKRFGGAIGRAILRYYNTHYSKLQSAGQMKKP